mgnify:CR=1 FL=1
MLLKFDFAHEIGRFASLKHKAPQFTRLTLVYARNGYGKSTLCAVLRSACDGQANLIHARRRLGATTESRVQTTWARAGTIAFNAGQWNSPAPDILIFDQEFINQNLHVGESVTRENKRSLLPVVLGEQGVALAQKIIALDGEQRDLDSAMKGYTAVISAKCPTVTWSNISAFCAREVPPDIEKKIDTAQRAVELAKQAVAVKQKKNPKTVEVGALVFFRELASRTLESVSADIAARVREHIENHHLTPNGDRWLKYGIDKLVGDSCPFCDQPVSHLDIIGVYRAFFSEAYASLIAERDSALSILRVAANGPQSIAAIHNENAADFAFWKLVCELPEPPTLSPEQLISIKGGIDALIGLLEQKVSNPLAVVDFGSSAGAIEQSFNLIVAYNAGIADCSAEIEAARTRVGQVDLKQTEDLHKSWLALQAKLSEPVQSAAEKYTAASARRAEVEKEKKTAQSTLTTFAKTTMQSKQNEINALLSDFGANFRIVDAKANFVGREPNTDYAIAIGQHKISVGEKSDIEPSFKTVLSAGDKATLALAFFISQVRAYPRLADAIVVFDDPFNSQDLSRQFETTSQIRSIAKDARQTIVLSHDPRFLQMIEKDADRAVVKTFQVLCAQNGEGAISQWSTEDELKELYVRRAEAIREYAAHGALLKDETLVSVMQGLRPFLEDYLRARFPGRFQDSDHLFEMAEAIQNEGTDDPMFGSVDDILAINEYSRPSMHGGSQVPDADALSAQCKKVVRIIGKY